MGDPIELCIVPGVMALNLLAHTMSREQIPVSINALVKAMLNEGSSKMAQQARELSAPRSCPKPGVFIEDACYD